MNVEKVISPVKGKCSMEVHSSISQTYSVSDGSVGLGSIRVGGKSALGICAFFYM